MIFFFFILEWNFTPFACPRQPNFTPFWCPRQPNFTPFRCSRQPNFTPFRCTQQPNFTPFRCTQHLLIETILPARPGPTWAVVGDTQIEWIWLLGHQNGVKFFCWGLQNGVKFGCLGHPNGVKFQSWNKLNRKFWDFQNMFCIFPPIPMPTGLMAKILKIVTTPL